MPLPADTAETRQYAGSSSFAFYPARKCMITPLYVHLVVAPFTKLDSFMQFMYDMQIA